MIRAKIDLILHNAKIYTMSQPDIVPAVAISGDRIIALGNYQELKKLSNSKTRHIDLKGLTVIPGFIDSHVHLYSYGLSLKRINMRRFSNLDEALTGVELRSRDLKRNEWLLGRGWDKNYWALDEFPDRYHLDSVCRNPCAFSSHDGHSLWVNSAVLKIAEINKNTSNPPGGVIRKDINGEPTGMLHESATSLVGDIVPSPDMTIKMETLMNAQKSAFRKGVTAVSDFDEDDNKYELLQNALLSGKLKLRVNCALRKDDFESIIDLPLKSGFGNDILRFGPLKLYADGALGSQTAWMIKPYESSKDKGVLALSKKDILYYIKKANDKGISCAIHAIGDRANKMIIDAYHSYSRTNRLITPNRIEHAQLLYPGAIEKLKSSGAIASVQPSHLIADRDTADKYWGDRCKYAYIFRTMLKNKIPTCFGSDAPIEKLDPLEGLYSAVNRCHPNDDRGAWFPNEKITVKQAVACYTTGAAFAMGMQGRLGKLSPGYLADMTVLSEDLFRIPPKNIHLTKVLGTISSGKIVYNKIK